MEIYLIISGRIPIRILLFRESFRVPMIYRLIQRKRELKKFNHELEQLCVRRKLTFLHTYRLFLHNNAPIRSYFAIRDDGLHLNTEGTRKLKLFLCNTVSHLK